MRTIEQKVYSFEELDESIQEKIIDENRYNSVESYDWYDTVFDDFLAIADILGAKITKRNNKFAIYFTGFYCQGAGSAFDGVYYYNESATKKIREYTDDTELHEIADGLKNIFRNFEERPSVDISSYRDSLIRANVDFECESNQHYETEIDYFLKRLNEWLFVRLQKEYDYLTGDECVKEGFEGCEFLEDGTFF